MSLGFLGNQCVDVTHITPEIYLRILIPRLAYLGIYWISLDYQRRYFDSDREPTIFNCFDQEVLLNHLQFKIAFVTL